MRTITEVYNNIPGREGLTPDWGFSCYIHEAKLLFDTGAKGDVLLSNMRVLGILPADIQPRKTISSASCALESSLVLQMPRPVFSESISAYFFVNPVFDS